jgi:hypothetical protein
VAVPVAEWVLRRLLTCVRAAGVQKEE